MKGSIHAGSLASRLLLALSALVASSFAIAGDSAADDLAIAQHRMGSLIIEGPPQAALEVEQLEHEFQFGAALANQAFDGRMTRADEKRYKEVFLENFNSAVTENALKWIDMEDQPGVVNYSVVDAMLDWTEQHGMPLRGHNIYWGINERVQPWLKELDDARLRERLRERAYGIATRYQGRFAEYDLNNEMIHGNYYEERFGPSITTDMAKWVKEADPEAVLYFNDYDILTGKWLDRYIEDIHRHLDRGAPFDGVGAQGHLHAESFDPETLRSSLDELAKIGLPIKITEFNFPGQRSRFMEDASLEMTPEQEEAKAQAIVDYYRICFAHPEVEGILMWGFWEGANWIPASSLYKRDWTPTPAAKAYHDLVYGEWWTRWSGETDRQGRRHVPAFYGVYRITCDGESRTVELKKSDGAVKVSF